MIDAIIYIHYGDSFYLDNVLRLTRKYNSDVKIILLGDDKNKHYAAKYGIEFKYISDYEESFNYHHVSVNSIEYEYFCFRRWLILSNFLKDTDYMNIAYSDSDNVIYSNINIIHELYTYDIYYLGNDKELVPSLLVGNRQFFNIIRDYILSFYNRPVPDVVKSIESNNYKYNNKLHYSDMFLISDVVRNIDRTKSTPIYNMGIERSFTSINLEHCNNSTYIFNASFVNVMKGLIKYNNDYYYVGKHIFNVHYNDSYKSEVRDLHSLYSRDAKSMIAFKYDKSINLGDEVQTHAALNIINNIYNNTNITDNKSICYIDRDDSNKNNSMVLNDISNSFLLSNGWFQCSDLTYMNSTNTIFIAFHISMDKQELIDKFFTINSSIFKGKKILCRDTYTMNLLKSRGFNAEFGACVTLFLKPQKYPIEKYTLVVQFHSEFKNLFDTYVKGKFNNIICVSQDNSEIADKNKGAWDHLSLIERAECVITSRIHTAFPCVAYRKRFSLIKWKGEKRLTGYEDILRKHWIIPSDVNTQKLCIEYSANDSLLNELYIKNINHILLNMG